VRNALAAAAIGWGLGIDVRAIQQGLAGVGGVARRFELVREGADLTIVDDYAHHPTEIAATLACAHVAFPRRRLVALFQPHLYSRTRDFALQFGAALAAADLVFVTAIYPAREAPIPGVSAQLVVAASRAAGAAVVPLPALEGEGLETAARTVEERLSAGDVVVTLGAGDVDRLAHRLAAGAAVR
jgi:UDP-N-acetylmuramate--alanine ligase